MEAEVLDLGPRTDAGSGKATDSTSQMPHCPAAGSKAHRRGFTGLGLQPPGQCSCCPPTTAEALPLAAKAMPLVLKFRFLPWALGPRISETGPGWPVALEGTQISSVSLESGRSHTCPHPPTVISHPQRTKWPISSLCSPLYKEQRQRLGQ